MTSIAILNSRPSLISKGVLSDDHLAEEVSSKGRLTALLERRRHRSSMTFAVDPALIEELQTMRAGYQVRQADGALVAGTGQAAAAEWLDKFAELKADHDGYRLFVRFARPRCADPLRPAGADPGQRRGQQTRRPDQFTAAARLSGRRRGRRRHHGDDRLAESEGGAARRHVGQGETVRCSRVLWSRGKSSAPIVSFTATGRRGRPRTGSAQHRTADPAADPGRDLDPGHHRDRRRRAQGRVRVITSAVAGPRRRQRAIDAPWLKHEHAD